MDVIFEPENGAPFTMIVDFYDTIEEIKLKIQHYYAIPAAEQIFILNGRVLPDDGDTDSCEIYQNSPIVIASTNKKVALRVKIPTPTPHITPIEMPEHHTVRNLKDKILESEPSLRSVTRAVLVLQCKGRELNEDRRLAECDVSGEDAVVEVSLRWRGSNTLKVTLRSKCGTRRIPVWVNASDNVEALRRQLRRLSEEFGFPLQQEYFFIHVQDVMDDDKSFRWHGVSQDDIIDVFPGSVVYGSTSGKVKRIVFNKKNK